MKKATFVQIINQFISERYNFDPSFISLNKIIEDTAAYNNYLYIGWFRIVIDSGSCDISLYTQSSVYDFTDGL